jgi:DNA-nicking Smr family endonuclease
VWYLSSNSIGVAIVKKARRGQAKTVPEKAPDDVSTGRLREALLRAGWQPARRAVPERAPKPPSPPPTPPEVHLNEEDAFIAAMSDVNRREWSPPPVVSAVPESSVAPDDGSEDRRMMEEALRGDSPGEVSNHPEYIEGWVDLSGRRYLPDLQSRHYSIQDSLDLHGFTRAEARIAVEEFIDRVARLQSCCVKIIHGRGINSPTDRGILKESLQQWLTSRRMSRHVVAYASAPFSDGGVGAVYLLLRRS